MSDYGKNVLLFDPKAIGKKPSKCQLYQPQKNKYKMNSLTKMIHKRELYGPSRHLSSLRCRVAVDTILLPKVKNSNGAVDCFMRCAVILGLSNDSSYALSLVVPDVCSYDRFLVVSAVTPTSFLPQYTVRVRERRPIDNFYASFSKNSFLVSVIVSPKLSIPGCLEPQFFDTNIYLLNLKHSLCVEMTANIRTSCRWKDHKFDRVCLRSTDYGAVLNNGCAIVAFIFLPTIPAEANLTRTKVFRIVKASDAGYEKSGENTESSVIIHGAHKMTSAMLPFLTGADYSFEPVHDKDCGSDSKTPVYFILSATDIASFIRSGTSKLVRHFSLNLGQIKCIDYELDIVECTSDFWVYSLVTTLIEVTKEAKALTYVGVFALNVNVLTKASDMSVWRKLRAVDVSPDKSDRKGAACPFKRDKWYPFGEKRVKSVEERIVSDECTSTGVSASLLTSPFPGIELEKSCLC